MEPFIQKTLLDPEKEEVTLLSHRVNRAPSQACDGWIDKVLPLTFIYQPALFL